MTKLQPETTCPRLRIQLMSLKLTEIRTQQEFHSHHHYQVLSASTAGGVTLLGSSWSCCTNGWRFFSSSGSRHCFKRSTAALKIRIWPRTPEIFGASEHTAKNDQLEISSSQHWCIRMAKKKQEHRMFLLNDDFQMLKAKPAQAGVACVSCSQVWNIPSDVKLPPPCAGLTFSSKITSRLQPNEVRTALAIKRRYNNSTSQWLEGMRVDPWVFKPSIEISRESETLPGKHAHLRETVTYLAEGPGNKSQTSFCLHTK